MQRTLHNLRESLSGKIYLYLGDAETRKQFAEDANLEGYRFGETKPTVENVESIIALKGNCQLNYVGYVGTIDFQCNGGSNAKGHFHRIDYAKYKRGDKDYYFVPNNSAEKNRNAKSAYHGQIQIFGENCEQAEKYFMIAVKSIDSYDAEEGLFDYISENYSVSVVYDD